MTTNLSIDQCQKFLMRIVFGEPNHGRCEALMVTTGEQNDDRNGSFPAVNAHADARQLCPRKQT